MGSSESKPKRAAEIAPKVRVNSPTSIETSTGFHLLEFHGPTVSNIVILGAFACFTALGVVFLYRHLSKKRRRKEARLLQAGRVDLETGTVGSAPGAPLDDELPMEPGWSTPRSCLPRRGNNCLLYTSPSPRD